MKFVCCTSCSRKSLVAKLPISLSVDIDLCSHQGGTISLTALSDTLNNYFQIDVVTKYAGPNGKDELEEKFF